MSCHHNKESRNSTIDDRRGRTLAPCLWRPALLIPAFIGAALCVLVLACEPSTNPSSSDNGPLAGKSLSESQSRAQPIHAGEDARHGVSATKDPETDEPLRIAAFGNSLTAGLGVAPAEAYPAQLEQRLRKAGYPVEVLNAGVSGETSAGGLRRVKWVLLSRPNLVILELGGNDGLRGIDPTVTRTNLEKIIKRFQAAEVPLVLAGMKLPPNYGKDFTARFAAIYPDLAQTYQLPFIPFFLEGVATRARLTQADGIHPTGEGYRVVVDNLLPVLEPLLAELAPLNQ